MVLGHNKIGFREGRGCLARWTLAEKLPVSGPGGSLGQAVLVRVRGGQPGPLLDADVNQISIFLSDRELGPQHLREVRVVPMSFHHATLGMPGAPLQYVDDLVHQHVCQQVRHKSRWVGLDTIAEDADLRAFVWRRLSHRTGLQGGGSIAGQRYADSVWRAGF